MSSITHVFSNESLLSEIELQEILDHVSGGMNNSLNSLEWEIPVKRGIILVSFAPILELSKNHILWSSEFPINLVLIAKYLWLRLYDMGASSESSIVARLKGICLLFKYLATNNSLVITPENFYPYVEYMLTHNFSDKENKLLNIKSYNQWARNNEIFSLMRCSKEISDGLFFQDIKQKDINNALTEAINILTDGEMTLNEWKDGGSFNFLTLDYGRYYVDYCRDFYEKHIHHAQVITRIIEESKNDLKGLGAKGKTKRAVKRILLNEDIDSLIKELSLNKLVAKSLHKLIHQKYQSYIAPLIQREFLCSKKGVDKLLSLLKLPEQQHIRDKTAFIVEQIDSQDNLKVIDKCFTGDFKHITLNMLQEACDAVKSMAPIKVTIPGKSYYESCGIEVTNDASNSILKFFVNAVRDAGVVHFVAINGWRKSEFGFPLRALKVSENIDPLDKMAYPLRFFVDWHVFKTHGDTLTEREITYSSYKVTKQLSKLHSHHDDCPALYFVKPNGKDIENSGARIALMVKSIWSRFIEHYEPFRALSVQSEIDKLLKKQDGDQLISLEDHKKIKDLEKLITQNKWESYLTDNQLKEAYRRSQKEKGRVGFFLAGSENTSKKDWLVKYKNYLTSKVETLPKEWIDVLDSYLSLETKEYIQSTEDETLREVSISRTISAEVVDDCLYPTPHAFRHMWAESVYRRYDGDAGWMIRSQFKHITPGMWLAYIRNKDNRNLNHKVQVAVKTSLLNSWLKNEGKDHAGKFNTYLRRLFNKTKLSSIEDLNALIDKLAQTELGDIKANPWGYCILRRKNREFAHCAEGGIPQPQNASPSFCLNCINNLTKISNIDYLVMESLQHLELLNIENLAEIPMVFLRNSYNFIRPIAKQISELEPLHDALEGYATAINAFEMHVNSEVEYE